MKSLFALTLFLSAISSATGFAQYNDPYDLKRLDVLETCKGAQQEINAELAMSVSKALFTWHVGDLVAMLHPDFIAWHSAMTDILVEFPVYRDKVPFKNGQFTKESIVATMAFIAYTNDSESYKAGMTRVDCVGDDKVILVADFVSTQINRDQATGCVTHKYPYKSHLKMTVQLKAHPTDPDQKLVYRFDTHVEDKITLKARAALAELVKTQPALKPDPATCKTQKMIFDEFNSQVPN